MTGGGVQTPGFMGHGKHFIASKKFMKAEGGIERIVWMPKELKEFIAEKLNATAKELYGIDNFTDMIGDETVATAVSYTHLMCLATVYKENDDSVIFKNVSRINVDGNKLVLRDIMRCV